jgi:hypothetical protein
VPVQVLNKGVRDDVYRRTLAAVMREIGSDDPSRLLGNCLEFAYQGYLILNRWPGAPRTILQAGSAQWPRVPPDLDDGISPTHFAYVWDSDSAIACLVREGLAPVIKRADGHGGCSLPEMHVWLGCPDTGELIDFTTGLWPQACKATLDEGWLAPAPPEYLWTFGDRSPRGVNYHPDRDAIDCVISLLHRQGRPYP